MAAPSSRETDPSSVGIMDGAFFVSRKSLLDWVNTSFNLSVSKVEECASGAIYLHIVDAIYPGSVPIGKVKWNAKQEYEYIHNYKLVQSVFIKHGVKKHIEVDRLIKGRYQDNLEFLQWMKAYYERTVLDPKPYDGVERRKLAGGPMPEWAKPYPKETVLKKPEPSRHNGKTTSASVQNQQTNSAMKAELETALAETKRLVEELDIQITEREIVEREKDFYFSKLREIEILCEGGATQINPADIQTILYKPETPENEPQAA